MTENLKQEKKNIKKQLKQSIRNKYISIKQQKLTFIIFLGSEL